MKFFKRELKLLALLHLYILVVLLRFSQILRFSKFLAFQNSLLTITTQIMFFFNLQYKHQHLDQFDYKADDRMQYIFDMNTKIDLSSSCLHQQAGRQAFSAELARRIPRAVLLTCPLLTL